MASERSRSRRAAPVEHAVRRAPSKIECLRILVRDGRGFGLHGAPNPDLTFLPRSQPSSPTLSRTTTARGFLHTRQLHQSSVEIQMRRTESASLVFAASVLINSNNSRRVQS